MTRPPCSISLASSQKHRQQGSVVPRFGISCDGPVSFVLHRRPHSGHNNNRRRPPSLCHVRQPGHQHVESIIGGIYNGASAFHATDQSLSFVLHRRPHSGHTNNRGRPPSLCHVRQPGLRHVESIIGGIYNGASAFHAADQSLSFYTGGGHTQGTTITAAIAFSLPCSTARPATC